MPSLRANAVSSALASASVTPWPTNSTGRRALRIRSSAAAISSGDGAAALRAELRRSRRHLDVVLLLEHVERHVDVHRPGPAGQHRGGRLAQRERQHVDARRLERALHHRPDHVDEIRLVVPVDLLERRAVELLRRHIRRDGEQRGGIRQRDLQRHHDIGGARPARGERRDRLVAHAEIGIRHVRGDLLVARRDELDPVARAVERIEHADIAVPADAEHVRDLVPHQMLRDQVGTLHPWHFAKSFVVPPGLVGVWISQYQFAYSIVRDEGWARRKDAGAAVVRAGCPGRAQSSPCDPSEKT